MGIKGLWTYMQPAGKAESLVNLSLDHLEQEGRLYNVGVDVSIWFHQSPAGLETIFFRCCRLRALPIRAIFVFDGRARPIVKRGHKVLHKNYPTLPSVSSLLDAFGFDYFEAPGEAEAQLASMNSKGIIDAIMTEDVDSFLFGANVILRRQSNNEDLSQVIRYCSNEISRHAKVSLGRSDILLIALLSGGDYESGLRGCGLSTAIALARTGLGKQLFEAAMSMTPHELMEYLHVWRLKLKDELEFNISGCLNQKAPTVAKRITDKFPNPDIIRLYTTPVVAPSLPELWKKRFNIRKLSRFMKINLDWTDELILQRIKTHVISSAVIDYLLAIISAQDSSSYKADSTQDTDLVTLIHKERINKASGQTEYSASVSVGTVFKDLSGDFDNLRSQLLQAQTLWIPAHILRKAVPHLVDSYCASKSISQRTIDPTVSRQPLITRTQPSQSNSNSLQTQSGIPTHAASFRDGSSPSGSESLPDADELIGLYLGK